MTTALLGIAKGKATTEPHLVAILTAQEVNRLAGGMMVTPFDVYQLPDEWLEAFSALARDLPEMRTAQAKVDAAMAELRKPKHGK